MSHYEYVGTTLYLSKLTLASIIMLSIYILPMLMRPKDFLDNLRGYVMGLITYLVILPMFVAIM